MTDHRNDKIDIKFYETMPSRLLVRSVREHADALCTIVEKRLEEPNPEVPRNARVGLGPGAGAGLLRLFRILDCVHRAVRGGAKGVLRMRRRVSSMRWWHRLSQSRPPDFIVGDEPRPYLRRWWVIPRNRFFNVYLHQFLRSDDDRALHDHRYVNISYLLEGSYVEHTIAQGGVHHQKQYCAGDVRLRLPTTAQPHRGRPAVLDSIYYGAAHIRKWGFHCPRGWMHWKEFVDDRDHGKVGRGCED